MTTKPVTNITDEQIAELETLASDATQGSWKAVDYGSYRGDQPHWYVDTAAGRADIFDEQDGTVSHNHWDAERGGRDMKYIAAANPETLLALITRLREAEADARRYRFLADNACDVIMSASMTDYGDRDTTSGPRVEVDPGQYPVETFGSAKLKLDFAIDAAMQEQQP